MHGISLSFRRRGQDYRGRPWDRNNKECPWYLPLPAPATLAILRNGQIPVRYTNEERELCTPPTGAALLAEFMATGRDEIPPDMGGYVTAVGGYGGAGTRNPSHMPNVFRASVCESGTKKEADTIDILETNVDDTTGEVIAYTIGRLMDAGARDASAIPLIMKKGRPGILIRVICTHALSGDLIRILAEELGTLASGASRLSTGVLSPGPWNRLKLLLDQKPFLYP